LLFQTLDDKKECVGLYLDGELRFNEPLPDTLSQTWNYSSFLENRPVEYANLYCQGKGLTEVCPEALRERWSSINNKLAAFYRSFCTARVSLNENCFYDLVPQKFLLEWCYVKDLICRHVFENYDRPVNYDYLADLARVLGDIRHTKLNIEKSSLRMHKSRHRKFAKNLGKLDPYCKFNIWGTKTGRLTTLKNSFPILTLDKTMRHILKPHNDYFVELDFNAAELRTLLSLSGESLPTEDMHAWNVKNIFGSHTTREQAKKRIFAWLYNPESKDDLCGHHYDRNSVVKKYFDGNNVTTVFNKSIPSEHRTALNYIIQSTCAENVLRQMVKVSDYLKRHKSYVAFPIHDSIVIDLSLEDKHILPEIIKMFSDTDMGHFKANISVGKNFGDLKKLEVNL